MPAFSAVGLACSLQEDRPSRLNSWALSAGVITAPETWVTKKPASLRSIKQPRCILRKGSHVVLLSTASPAWGSTTVQRKGLNRCIFGWQECPPAAGRCLPDAVPPHPRLMLPPASHQTHSRPHQNSILRRHRGRLAQRASPMKVI